jgi:hypothetical protein
MNMPAKVRDILRLFRGKRIAIVLAAAGIVVFVVLGGHQKILSLAVGEMEAFLLGAVDRQGSEAIEIADIVEMAPTEQDILPGSAVLAEMAAAEALAASVDAQTDEPQTKAAEIDTSAVEPPLGEDLDLPGRKMKVYTASFLRDPFYSLISADEEHPTRLLDVGRAKMVGSVWGETGIIALLEDDRDRSFALKVGDRVINGRVVAVTPASITFSITMFGLTKSVTLELSEEGEW